VKLGLVFVVAVLVFLPTVRYGFVQDDRAIIAANPAAHSIATALRAFGRPYWPRPSEGGLYRPLTILSYAVDWSLSGGRPGWMHCSNALLHGLVAVLIVLVVARWLPGDGGGVGALAAGFVFAVHPVHVEGVASLVSRAELLAAVGILGALLAARRGWWAAALALSAAAMLSKEHGVVGGVAILLDDWLHSRAGRLSYPRGFYAGLGMLTLLFLGVWWHVGGAGARDVAPPFLGASTGGRLAIAFPAIWRAARLLVWPLDLSADYNPQVIPAYSGLSLPAVAGAVVVAGAFGLAWRCRRRAPAITFATIVAALALAPTSNLFFASGVVLAERALYLPVLLVATGVGLGVAALIARGRRLAAGVLAALVVCALGARTLDRLPVWRDNRTFLLTLLAEHPESYRAHASAAAVYAGMGDTAGARREYAVAESLFDHDPHLDAARAFYLLGLGDTLTAAPLVSRARSAVPGEPFALRAQLLLLLKRGDRAGVRALADSVRRFAPADSAWYSQELR